ncbi:MAG: amylo-alpha-1,6-glucosidase [Acidobacteriaceae bacterium]
MIDFDQAACKDLITARKREWIVTNGIGGYASSTVAGMNTRRYHGLLIAATKPPLGRIVMLSQMEDALIVDGARFDLSTNMYLDNVVHPSGHLNLAAFRLDPYPIFTYAHDDWKLEKSVFMVRGENTTVIEYSLTHSASGHNVSLEVRPLIAFRDYHGTTRENDVLNRSVEQMPGCVGLHPYASLPKLYLAHSPAMLQVDGYWYKNFEYEEERARGLDYVEDLFSPLVVKIDMNADRKAAFIVSTEVRPISKVGEYKRAEVLRESIAHFHHRGEFGRSDLIPTLHRAAEQFIVTRAPHQTLLAGYHWFGDWGRDAMIALPGLLLATDQPGLAKEILLEYARYIDGGMLPNRFPDRGEDPEYNTVDATLWFFEAIRQYFNHRKDNEWRAQALELMRECLYAVLKGIVRAHVAGTRYGIHVDQAGFLWAGDTSSQLTWMDAKVGNVAITPRAGRPVEIQALWYNALRILEHFGHMLGDGIAADSCAELAHKLQSNFEAVFWNEQGRHLHDVVGDSEYDGSLRPNQIFAVSLHHALLKGDRARNVVDVVERELLTPYGLRTLSSKDRRYCGRYEGDVWSRDSAYHQGTVWPWLAGPFFFAKLSTSDSVEGVLPQIDAWLDKFTAHLREAGLGQVSEIFDGDAPHAPRGCIAQAWSVAEILRLAKLVARHPSRRRE